MSATARAGLYPLTPAEIQRSGALRGSIPRVLERFSGVLRGGDRGTLALLNLFPQHYVARDELDGLG